MSVLFSLRGDTLAAYRAVAGGTNYTKYEQSGAPLIGVTSSSDPGVIGGSVIDLAQYGFNTYLGYAGFGNYPDGTAPVSALMRCVFLSTGAAPSVNNNVLGFNPGDGSAKSTVFFQQQGGTANWLVRMYDFNGNLRYNATPFTWFAASLQTYDLLYTWDGTNNAGACKFYIDNSLMATWNPTVDKDSTSNQIASICLGGGVLGQNTSIIKLNEFVIWDEVVNPSSVLLESGTTTALNGVDRSSFVACDRFDPLVYSDPGVGNVKSGETYVIEGNTLTGTYNVPVSTDPGVANVLSGTGYTINDVSFTGSLTDDYDNPGVSNVKVGTVYRFAGTTLTGTLNVPEAMTGSAGTVPINEIKEQIRYILNQNNTTTGFDVIDLSANLTRRVQKVAKVNPEKLMMLANELPAVSIFTSQKSVEQQTIAKNMATGKRRADVTITVCGVVWNPYTTNALEDPADDDLENLMENVERVLRSYDTLSNNNRWHLPTDITYHTASFDEQTHFRVAFMDLRVTTYY